MKNQSGTIKTNLELYRVVMGGSGGYRRLTGGSDDFLLQTNTQTDTHHNIYIIITEMMTCNEVETKAGRCSPRELTGVHAAQPSCTLGRLLVNIDMLLLMMRMMSIVMLVMIMIMWVMMVNDVFYCGGDDRSHHLLVRLVASW